MNILRFLREQAKEYDCSVCGTNHSRSDIRVLGKLESAWIVRVTCARCQTASWRNACGVGRDGAVAEDIRPALSSAGLSLV